jgi:threonine dehydrogenase-like Zn-dependent dehydrogenase
MVGDGVSLAIGQEVIVNPYLACGKCLGCQAREPACEAVDVQHDGGLCERICVPAANLYPTEGLALAEASSIELLAVGARAVRRSTIAAGKRALVMGAGPVGLGTALIARIAGLNGTIADRARYRLDFTAGHFGLAVAETTDLAAERMGSASSNDCSDVVSTRPGTTVASGPPPIWSRIAARLCSARPEGTFSPRTWKSTGAR